MTIDYPLVDADAHYYEPYDAWTRYMEPGFREMAVNSVPGTDGIGRIYQGDQRLRFSPSWNLDYADAPGTHLAFFLGEDEGGANIRHPIDPKDFPEFYTREARIAFMDKHGVQATLMYPTTGVQVEHDLRKNVPALYANVRAFNRWVADEWGWSRGDRIFSAAALSLIDSNLAEQEVKRVIEDGAQLVYLCPGPVYGRSPGDRVYDRFWSVLNEAEVPVVFHIGDCTARLAEAYSSAWGENPEPALHRFSAFQQLICYGDRVISDTLGSLTLSNLFGRFPNVRVLSVELGSDWVEGLMKHMDKAYRHAEGRPNWVQLTARPSEVLREHLWVSPFYEDDVSALVKILGADRILFGSDYPHPEGVVEPVHYSERLVGLSDQDVRLIMRENTAGILGLKS